MTVRRNDEKEDDESGELFAGDRKEYERTGNPLIVWNVIRRLGMSSVEHTPDGPRASFSVNIPPWCVAYLCGVAFTFQEHARGRDPDLMPAWRSYCGSNDEAAYERDMERWQTEKSMTPKRAIEKAASSLGLSRPGWNAFKEVQGWSETWFAYGVRLDARERGMSAAEATTEAARALGSSHPEDYDERTLRRRLKQAKRPARGKPKG